MDIFSIFFNMKVCCVFSLESPHRGDSNENRQHTIFNRKKENHPNCPKSAAWDFFQGTQKRVRNSPGKRTIEVLLYSQLLIPQSGSSSQTTDISM